MLTDDTARILEALRGIPDVTVATKWPVEVIGQPVLLVTLAGDKAVDYRDNRAYLCELEYYVRVFAARGEDMRNAASAAHEAMEALGYTKVFRWEESGEDAHQTVFRYKIWMKA